MNKQSLDTVDTEDAVEYICFSKESTGISHNDGTTPNRDCFKSTGDILKDSG